MPKCVGHRAQNGAKQSAANEPAALAGCAGGFHYPSYEELPADLLFLSQVVDYVNGVHAGLSSRSRHGRVITGSIVSNWVKRGLTPSAIGKRYGRDHVALILFAVTVKLLASAEDVMDLADAMFPSDQVAACHDRFAAVLNAEFNQPAQPACDDDLYVLTARAFAAKMRALTLVGEGAAANAAAAAADAAPVSPADADAAAVVASSVSPDADADDAADQGACS